ncbi:MAG: nucleotidyl transferase AbiEii/AbiGii toxin family protein [Legionellaceae bacterium]|nr:nucleotidyl transferase AbiEii/AbiGii toxin family protein [Legionellaceae bacterium]
MKSLRIKIQDEMSLQQAPMYVIEKDYALSYVLAGIARESKLSHSLIFKGGTALKKLFFGDYRFSEDLDFSAMDAPKAEELETCLNDAAQHWRATLGSLVRELPDCQLILDETKNLIEKILFIRNLP